MSATHTLQAQLDAITLRTRSLVPPERLATVDGFVADLQASGLERNILARGAAAPAFALTDAATGKMVRSDDLLALGPLVLVFFRGRWDPYCMTTLEAWQKAYAEVRARGALLAAISPQLPRQNAFAVEQHHLAFPLLSDPGCAVGEQFRVAYAVPEAMQQHLRATLVNLAFLNGDSSWRLPLRATFVLSKTGQVQFAEAHADHRVSTEPKDVLELL